MNPFAGVARPDAGRGEWRRPSTWLLLGLLLLLLTGRQLYRAYTAQIDIIHLGYLLQYFEMFDNHLFWGSGPGTAGLTFKLNGSLYYWLHLPIRFFENPFLGLHLLAFVLEAGGLMFWVLWGLRSRLSPPLLWLSALFLVAAGNPSGQLLENGQTANLLVVPLVMAMIGALTNPSARAMVLPGVLLSLVVQVQQAYLIAAVPTFLLLMMGGKGRRWRRLAWTLAGACVAYLPALPAVLFFGPEQLKLDVNLASSFQPEVLWSIARVHQPELLALFGLVLILGRGVTLPEAWLPGRVAAVWLVCCWPTLVGALLLVSPIIGDPSSPVRFGMLAPARSLLSAVVLLWLGWLLKQLLGRLSPEPRPRLWGAMAGAAVVAGACAVVIVGLVPGVAPFRLANTARDNSLRFREAKAPAGEVGPLPKKSTAQGSTNPCCLNILSCDAVTSSLTHYHLARGLLQIPWDAAHQSPIIFHGPASDYLNRVQLMLDASLRRETNFESAASRHVLALPCSMKSDLPQLQQGCVERSLLYLPNVAECPVAQAGSGHYTVSIAPSPRRRRLFAVTWRGREFSGPQHADVSRILIWQGDRKVSARTHCLCGTDMTAEVALFELTLPAQRPTRLVSRSRWRIEPPGSDRTLDVVEIFHSEAQLRAHPGPTARQRVGPNSRGHIGDRRVPGGRAVERGTKTKEPDRRGLRRLIQRAAATTIPNRLKQLRSCRSSGNPDRPLELVHP